MQNSRKIYKFTKDKEENVVNLDNVMFVELTDNMITFHLPFKIYTIFLQNNELAKEELNRIINYWEN